MAGRGNRNDGVVIVRRYEVAIHFDARSHGLPRFARNDGCCGLSRCCHCEERSDVAIAMTGLHGLPRCARNDGIGGLQAQVC